MTTGVRKDTFWDTVRHLRAEGRIPLQWTRNDIRPHLKRAGFSDSTINTVPFNYSISPDRKVEGNSVKERGASPQAWRVGPGLFELIAGEDISPPARLEVEPAADSYHAFVSAVCSVAAAKRAQLNRLKQSVEWDQEDFIWESLLCAMATWGNSRGAAFFTNEDLHGPVRFAALADMSAEDRRRLLAENMARGGVRRAERKAVLLCENYDRIVRDHGPAAVKRKLEACAGRQAKIRFLKTFRGIGDKYARNLMMDVYHPEFRDSIAIDERVSKFSVRLGIDAWTYKKKEQYFLRAARDAGLNGWELDRLLYNFTDDVLRTLDVPPRRSTRKEIGSC
jgi:hypothetical protein